MEKKLLKTRNAFPNECLKQKQQKVCGYTRMTVIKVVVK